MYILKLPNHNYCLWTDIDKILHTKFKFQSFNLTDTVQL